MHAFTEGLNAFSALWAGAMVRVLWQGGLALLAVGLVCRLAPRVPAHVQCWLWRLAYAKLYFVMLGLAPVELPLLPPSASVPAEVSLPASVPTAAPVMSSSVPMGTSFTPVAAPPEVSPFGWLALGWVAALGCWAVRIRRQYRETHRVRMSCMPVEDPEVLGQARELSLRLGLRAAPEILVTDATRGPFLAGVLRPAVVLPQSHLSGGDPEELRLVLAHELAHLKRRDLPWTWLPTLAQGLFPFHPLVWWAQREWSVAVETACDELVLRETAAPPARYARMLLDTATRFGGDTQLRFTTVGVVGSCRSLRRRLQKMHHIRPLSASGQRLTTVTLVAVGALTLVPWRVVAAPEGPAPTAVRPAEAPVEVREVKRNTARLVPGEPPRSTPTHKSRSTVPAPPRTVGRPAAENPVPARPVPPTPTTSLGGRGRPEELPAPGTPRAEVRPVIPPPVEVPAPPRPLVPAEVRPPAGVRPPAVPTAPRQPAETRGDVRPVPAAPAPPVRPAAPARPVQPAEPGIPILKDIPYIGSLFRTPREPLAAADPAQPRATNQRRPDPVPSTPAEPRATPAVPAPRTNNPYENRLEAPGDNRFEAYALKHIYVTDLQHLLQNGSGLPTGVRQITPDERTNTLLIQGTPAPLERLKAAIRLLDVPMQIDKGRFRIRLKPSNAKLEEVRLQVLALPGAQEAELEPDALVLRGSNLWVRQAMAVAARLEMGLGADRSHSRGSVLQRYYPADRGAARGRNRINPHSPRREPNSLLGVPERGNDFRPPSSDRNPNQFKNQPDKEMGPADRNRERGSDFEPTRPTPDPQADPAAPPSDTLPKGPAAR